MPAKAFAPPPPALTDISAKLYLFFMDTNISFLKQEISEDSKHLVALPKKPYSFLAYKGLGPTLP